MALSTNMDEHWISRCFALARRGIGVVSPNPPVGAVLVHQNKIIGEGYHTGYGKPHAEVEAFNNVHPSLRHLICEATLYISLEPCCVYGKTPPCTNLIIDEGVKTVCFSCTDPNPKVAGNGMRILQDQGIHVRAGVLEEEGRHLIRAFATNILWKRPYIILKWAESRFGFIGQKEKRILISHPHTNAWAHQLRAEADAILVGAHTVLIDNPRLTTRDFHGTSPHRVIYDPSAMLSGDFHVFNKDEQRVYYFSSTENLRIDHSIVITHVLDNNSSHVQQIISVLFADEIGILLVEGGAHVLSLFIKEDFWDEAWITRSSHELSAGVKAPLLKGKLIHQFTSATDQVVGIENENRKQIF